MTSWESWVRMVVLIVFHLPALIDKFLKLGQEVAYGDALVVGGGSWCWCRSPLSTGWRIFEFWDKKALFSEKWCKNSMI